jgi:GNAT superfamily N-acetyltransferase
MPIDLLIREYKKSDINIVLNLNKAAMERIGVYKEGPEYEKDLRDIKGQYFRNRGTFLIGTVNGIIVSMGAFRRLNNDTAEIKRMRTYPEYQGRGYGEMLLKELIRLAKQYGYKKLILETSDKQTNARKLYSKLGFEEYKKELIDGFNCAWFKLVLA